ncbi:hypothetical protein B0H16DRAFT_1895922 [Mycena metata]|uniref:Nephrocystin 3-like N-terminal domain-containing protein n=1 Tax=Mycena metata TaxID=1033252 RepID=A0AAD7MM44_9AGAR|nr:hypothetical protein B0H16DRAFT_1895922 [Mycena metata]
MRGAREGEHDARVRESSFALRIFGFAFILLALFAYFALRALCVLWRTFALRHFHALCVLRVLAHIGTLCALSLRVLAYFSFAYSGTFYAPRVLSRTCALFLCARPHTLPSAYLRTRRTFAYFRAFAYFLTFAHFAYFRALCALRALLALSRPFRVLWAYLGPLALWAYFSRLLRTSVCFALRVLWAYLAPFAYFAYFRVLCVFLAYWFLLLLPLTVEPFFFLFRHGGRVRCVVYGVWCAEVKALRCCFSFHPSFLSGSSRAWVSGVVPRDALWRLPLRPLVRPLGLRYGMVCWTCVLAGFVLQAAFPAVSQSGVFSCVVVVRTRMAGNWARPVARIPGGHEQQSACRCAAPMVLVLQSAGDAPNPPRLFLLSMRSGGLGVNLTAADTVIFDDQDWPADGRAGAGPRVLIFRLVSAHTIEAKIMQRATEKRKLEALIVAKGKFKIPASADANTPGRRTPVAEMAADLLPLEGEQIDVLPTTTHAGDADVLSDGDLESLLDRSPEVFADRGTGWKSSAKGQAAFAVFEPPADAGSDALAGLMDGEEAVEARGGFHGKLYSKQFPGIVLSGMIQLDDARVLRAERAVLGVRIIIFTSFTNIYDIRRSVLIYSFFGLFCVNATAIAAAMYFFLSDSNEGFTHESNTLVRRAIKLVVGSAVIVSRVISLPFMVRFFNLQRLFIRDFRLPFGDATFHELRRGLHDRVQGQQPMVGTMNINNLNGGYGGAGGSSEYRGGKGGVGQGNILNANEIHVYGSSSATDLLPWFAPKALFNADPGAGGAARGPCTKNTRQELLSRLKQWACDASDSLPIFWLSGMAGTGKSTVAYTLCEHWRRNNCLGASFFCSRNDEKARSRSCIIPTLVHQLLYSHKPFAHSLRDVPINVVGPASARHVEELLVEPWLQSMDSQSSNLEQPPLVVVIDALDEIEGLHDGPQLIKQLIQAVSAFNPRFRGLKFFVTSRPHPDIKKECSSIDQQAVYQMEEITTEKAFEDVGRFVRAQLPDLHPNWQKAIVTNSSGLFIYAATIVRYLCTHSPPLSRKQQENRLDKLWKSGVNTRVPDSKHGIDSLYDTITQVLHNNSPEVEISRRVLYAVVTTRRPLTVSDLAPLVVDASEEADEEAVRNSVDFLFHAVLYISPRDKCIYTFHKSFVDYILDPDCLGIMDKYLHFNMCNLESSFLLDQEVKDLQERVETAIKPELRYACQYWAAQLASVKQDSKEEEVQQLSASLLGFYRLKVLFWMETMNLLKLDCQFATNLARIWVLQVPNEKELKNYTAAVQRLWASFSRGQLKESTPHLYVSSLATDLALTSGVTLTKWRQHFLGIPSIKCKGIFLYRMLRIIEGYSQVSSVVFSPDGAHIVFGSRDKTVRIWDAITGAEVIWMEGHSGEVTSVVFSPDGAHIVSGSHDKTVRIWDAITGAEVIWMEGHSGEVTSVAFSPDGAHIVSGSYDKTVRIWDATTGAEVTRMEGHSGEVTSVAFSPDGAHIVSSSYDRTVRIWDATTGAEVTRMEGHSYCVTSVVFSPSGAHIVSGSNDGTVCIWDVIMSAKVTRMEGHNSQANSVAFSLNGAHIVSGSDDETIRIWDATTSAEVTKMEDGWVVQHGEPKIRFFWYPPALHDTLFFPPCLHLISDKAQTRLELHAHTLGTNWQQIYCSPPSSALEY